MTTRLLHEIDLARIAPQPDEMKRTSLQQMKGGFPSFSYRPVRSCFPDIFNVQPELDLGPAPPTPWSVIETQLKKRSKSDEELTHNLMVALGLYEFTTSGRVIAREHEFFPLPMGIARKLKLWLDMIMAIDERPSALFIDPRRSRGLTAAGRRFVLSVMHERIRAPDEDFAEVQLTIAQFEDESDGRRAVRLYNDEGIKLYSREELEQMVAATYKIWREVLEDRRREAGGRRTGTGPLI